MTTYEHAMLGVTGALAAGLDRRWGWPIVAMAAVVAVLPDWDSLSLLVGPAAFDRIHRTLGHNLPACVLLGAVAAAVDYRFRVVPRAANHLGRLLRLRELDPRIPAPNEFHLGELVVWVTVGVVAALSHLAADMVFSGHPVLPQWGIRLFWPFSDRFWAWPMVPWGDPGPTLLFIGGMFAMIRWHRYRQAIAALTLILVFSYIVARGSIFT